MLSAQEAVAQGAELFGNLPIGAMFIIVGQEGCPDKSCTIPLVWVKDGDRSCYTDHWLPLRGLEHSWNGSITQATLTIPYQPKS